MFFMILLTAPEASAVTGMDQHGKQWVPLEWTLAAPAVKGNPFDVDATVTFTHSSGRQITTGIFYAGKDMWKFRFTAPLYGQWKFETTSEIQALGNRRGTATIENNPAGRGFVTCSGSKWAFSGTGEVFIPQLVMYNTPDMFYNDPERIDRDIQTFIVEHGFNGFHTYVFCRWFDIQQERATDLASKDPNPDLRTFEALELLINKTYASGGIVHLWMWGDEQRRQTPIGLGGKNGLVDRRLQRYIAARLGPVPGWTMGYGFDLDEWVQEKDLKQWHAYMHRHMGWSHMLGGRSVGPNHYQPGIDFPQVYEGLDYASYEQHRPTYEAYCATIKARPDKPSFSEDRFRIRQGGYPEKDYTEEMTRRGLWHSAMAGGVANIWGLLDGQSHTFGSKAYSNPNWIKTYSVFFKNRFRKDMFPNNSLTDGMCLADADNIHFVFYRENAESIELDLSAAKISLPAIAVDALKPYKEIKLEMLKCGSQTWTAPYKSDWAIAVGDYPGSHARR